MKRSLWNQLVASRFSPNFGHTTAPSDRDINMDAYDPMNVDDVEAFGPSIKISRVSGALTLCDAEARRITAVRGLVRAAGSDS